MLNINRFGKTKPIPITLISVFSVLFLFMLSFTYSGSASAAAPSGGFGVGRGQGSEVGINMTAFNAVKADVNAGMYDRACQPDESDVNKWHSLVNIEKKCHYDHQHNDDPNYVNDIFGVPGAWFGSPGMEISYPWQTFKAATADEQNSAFMANHQMENDLKHEGYIWIVRRDQPCPSGNCVTDFRIQVHAIMGAGDMPVRYHSYSMEARVCVNASDPASCGIMRYGGWMDMGILVTRPANDVNCNNGAGNLSRDIRIPLAADSLYFPLDRPESRDEVRCHPNITNLPAYPPTVPLAEWWGHGGGETRFQVRSYDPIGNVDPVDPTRWQFFCAQTDMNCRYDASMFSVFVGYVEHVHEFLGKVNGVDVPVDANRDGRTDYKGYFTRWGALNPTCTAPGLDCIPYQYDNIVLNFFNNKDARYFHTSCNANCNPTDYDISPPGKRWITWFYRYAPGGTNPTPVPPTPVTPAPVTPTPTVPMPTEPSLVVSVNPPNANLNSTITVDLLLANVQNVYGLQTVCKVDPAVLGGTTRSDGDVFNANNSFFVDKGFQADGSWVIGASRLQPNTAFAGNGIAFKLGFTVKALSASSVTCTGLAVDANGKEIALKIVNGSFNGASAATAQPTTVQPTAVPPTAAPPTMAATIANTVAPTTAAGSTITGKMIYQNYPDNAGITVQLVDTQGKVITTVTTGADGAYTLTNVPMGTFGVTAVGNLYLRIGKVVTITTAGPIDLGVLTLPGGDTDNSGDITVADAGLIGANFDVPVNPAPRGADVNGDGMINIRDLAIVGGNFGLKGPILIK